MPPKGYNKDDEEKRLDDMRFLTRQKQKIEGLLELQSNQYWQLKAELEEIEKKIEKLKRKAKEK
jgi:predicted RNase H-like nuclease (RuvC/YqgF family)